MMKRRHEIIILAGLLSASMNTVFAADISTHTFSSACNLPDTGQTVHYAAGVGDDADYRPAATRPSFTIYNPVGASSVTVDNHTGLMWVTNPNDAGIGAASNWENAISACEGLNYAGFSDWRLPNIKELISIADYSRAGPGINTTYFAAGPAFYYWSSTTNISDIKYAVAAADSNNVFTTFNKTLTAYVRCVRGGP